MPIIQAFTGALGGTFADQWKEIITTEPFDELTVVSPGVLQRTNNGRGTNFWGSEGVISKGSKIFVPENTAAFIFGQSGIEQVITTPGGYEYQDGQETILNGDGIKKSFIDQVANRITFGGQTSDQKLVAFVNMREIRGIKFGTRGPLIYNDLFYGTDLEIMAFGTFSLRVADVEKFIRNFVPANVKFYSFAEPASREQLVSEFIQSFTVAVNALSSTYRISQLPSQSHNVVAAISSAGSSAATWLERFGIEVVNVGVESVEFTPESRELVKQFSSNLMNLKAYEGISQQSSNIAAQQKIAQGVQENGLGDGGGLLFGMNLAQGMNPQNAQSGQNSQPAQAAQATQPAPPSPAPAPEAQAPAATAQPVAPNPLSLDEQVDAVKKMKELLDSGLITEEEYTIKKKEIMGF